MKTTSLLFLFGFSSFLSHAQSIASPTLTSGGSSAGILGSGSTYYGFQAGKISTAQFNTFIGNNTGMLNTGGSSNLFVGSFAGMGNVTGTNNVLLGTKSGVNVTGSNNTFTGTGSGTNLDQTCPATACPNYGNNNSFFGAASGSANSTGSNNVFLGSSSGFLNTNGQNNTYIGVNSGSKDNGSGNVFLGANSGSLSAGKFPVSSINNQLFIDNSATTTPLIWGDFAMDQLKLNGKVGIGFGNLTIFPTSAGAVDVSNYKLFVAGGILAEEMRIKLRGPSNGLWADYVFLKEYKLKTIFEVEKYIKQNGHLENVPTAEDVKKNGLNLSEIARIQQEKIEELTLYMIEQAKKIKILEDILINK